MSEFFRSKVAMFLAGAYLTLILVCVGYVTLIDSSNVVVHLGLMIWTFPWSLLFPLILVKLGMLSPGGDFVVGSNTSADLIFLCYTIVGGLINGSIIYFLGLGVRRVFKHFSS